MTANTAIPKRKRQAHFAHDGARGARAPIEGTRIGMSFVLYHPDYTVGLGVTPSLLTLRTYGPKALAG